MTKPHQLIPGDFFTKEQWAGVLAPHLNKLVSLPGGVLLISVEVDPEFRNYPEVGFAVLSRESRATIKRALEASKRKAQKNNLSLAGHAVTQSVTTPNHVSL